MDKRVKFAIEGIGCSIIVGIFLFLRITYYDFQQFTLQEGTDIYLDALVSSEGILINQKIMIDYIYTYYLSIVLLFLGNSEICVIYANLFLQMITMICIYFGIRNFIGPIVAMIVSAFLSVFVYFVEIIGFATSIHLTYLFTGILLLSSSFLVCYYKRKMFTRENIDEDLLLEFFLETDESDDIEMETSADEKSLDGRNVDDKCHNVKSKTEFIKNPLPLPPKHVNQELEYKFEPNEVDMHYDVDDENMKMYYDV
ncbi:MAG: hypothetical protein R3Y24_02030 [Eubacteriales bacterium]